MKQTMPCAGLVHDPPLGHAEEADVQVVEALALRRRRASSWCGRRSTGRALPPPPCRRSRCTADCPGSRGSACDCLTLSAASCSSSNSGNGRRACGSLGGSQPVRALVR